MYGFVSKSFGHPVLNLDLVLNLELNLDLHLDLDLNFDLFVKGTTPWS